MSRRPVPPRLGEADRRSTRMALGGRLKSESRVERFWRDTGATGTNVDISEPPPVSTLTRWTSATWSADPLVATPESITSLTWEASQVSEESELVMINFAHNVTAMGVLWAQQDSSSIDPLPSSTLMTGGISGLMGWSVWKTTWPAGVRGRLLQKVTENMGAPYDDRIGLGFVLRRVGGAATLNVQLAGVQTGGASTTWPTVPAGWQYPTQIIGAAPVASVGTEGAKINDIEARSNCAFITGDVDSTCVSLTHRIDAPSASGTVSALSPTANNVWVRIVLGWT